MAQYQGRTGPIANDASAVTPDMLRGCAPVERSRAPRSFQRSTIALAPDVPIVSEEPLFHTRPISPRSLGVRTFQRSSLTVPPDIAASAEPWIYSARPTVSPRLNRVNAFQWNSFTIPPEVIPFADAMFFHRRPEESRALRVRTFQRSTVTVPPDDVSFADAMLWQARPASARPHRPSKGPSFFPFSGTCAAHSPDMFRGVTSDTSRAEPPQRSQIVAAPDVPVFSIEMVVGSRPHSPRIQLAARIPLSLSQTTHVTAPLTADMVAGWMPDRQRYVAPFHNGARWWTPETLDFSIEMILATRPERPRKDLAPKIPAASGWSVSQTTDVLTFSPDMALGYAPHGKRYIAPLRGSSLPQLPEVQAFSIEMVTGSHPDRPRYVAPFRLGTMAQFPDIQIFSIEMVAGSRPDRPRVLLGVRIPLPVAQSTHVEAPFSYEMVRGLVSYHLPRIAWRNGWLPDLMALMVAAPTSPAYMTNDEFLVATSSDLYFVATES